MGKAEDEFALYHNPRCSKSRSALSLLLDQGVSPTVIEYLKTPPSKDELRDLIGRLGIKPEALVRKSEAEYKEHYAGKRLTDEEWLEAMASNPILIERPIAVKGERAVVGRPPERVLELVPR